MPLAHFAEPYSAQGNIDARAAAKAIGRPRLDAWDVFLRETVQNTWDARSEEGGGVTFCIDGTWPDAHQMELLRSQVFNDTSGVPDLAEFLSSSHDETPLLIVTDYGTKGLGGPTRADVVSSDSTDFVDFARNVGRASEKRVGGGTYGFGKGVLWQMSECSTVLIYTKTSVGGRPVSRFFGMGHSDPYDLDGRKYTGRHWWGEADLDTSVEPLTGEAADAMARALGMTRLENEVSGTAIMILGPIVSDRDKYLRDIVGRLARAASWWAWPHLVDGTIDFRFSCDGEDITVPAPQSDPILKHFVDAYERAVALDSSQSEWPWSRKVIRSSHPTRALGVVVWRRIPHEDLGPMSHDVEIHSNIALMRAPRLVVRYLPVRPDPLGQGTVGVFVANPDLNDEFAKSEPVAHDDWAPENLVLEKGATNPVRVALNRLKAVFAVAPVIAAPAETSESAQHGLVQISTSLGDLIEGAGDASIRRGRAPTGGGGARAAVSVRIVGEPMLGLVEGMTVATFRFEVSASDVTGSVIVTGSPYVLTESGSERVSESPLGLPESEVLGWTLGGQAVAAKGRSIEVDGGAPYEGEVSITVPPDSAVTLRLSAAPERSRV